MSACACLPVKRVSPRTVSAPVEDFVSARGAQLLEHVQAVLVVPGLLPVALPIDPPKNLQPFRGRHLCKSTTKASVGSGCQAGLG